MNFPLYDSTNKLVELLTNNTNHITKTYNPEDKQNSPNMKLNKKTAKQISADAEAILEGVKTEFQTLTNEIGQCKQQLSRHETKISNQEKTISECQAKIAEIYSLLDDVNQTTLVPVLLRSLKEDRLYALFKTLKSITNVSHWPDKLDHLDPESFKKSGDYGNCVSIVRAYNDQIAKKGNIIGIWTNFLFYYVYRHIIKLISKKFYILICFQILIWEYN